MKKKCTLLSLTIMVLLFPLLKSNGQTQSVVFTTPSISYVSPIPAPYQYGYSYTQSIYMSNLFDVLEGNITTIMYYWNGGNANNNNDLTNSNVWTIYMGHRTDTMFNSTTAWLPLNSLTEVFSDTIQVTGPGWMAIELTTPFHYNAAQGNLVIAVDENAPGAAYPTAILNTGFRSGSLWPGSNPKSLYRYNNNINIDPSAPGTAGATQFVNHIRMNITPITGLPIVLKEFRAVNAGSHNLLYWTSAAESADDTYIVERSRDGKTFTEISHLDAKGPSDMAYHFTDEAPFAGISYYRLRLRSKDGKVNFSTVVNAIVKQGGFQAKLYPNPARDKVTIAIADASGKSLIQVCDLLGHSLKAITPDPAGNTTIDLGFLPAGTYFVKYKDDTHLETLELIKK